MGLSHRSFLYATERRIHRCADGTEDGSVLDKPFHSRQIAARGFR